MKKYNVLIADDEQNTRNGIKLALDKKRFSVETAENGDTAFELFKKNRHHLVITDLRMARENDGMLLLENVKKLVPETVVIMITAYGDLQTAVDAMKLGAFDFVAKPFTADQIEVKVNKAADSISLRNDNKLLRKELSKEYALIGESGVMNELNEKIALVAKTDTRVLITGDNGTGKELVARAIQKMSLRTDKPFVKVNCAAIPETLIEAVLFGSEKGSFTGSTSAKTGKFEQADSGTLFLDEIGDMSLSAQAKVLRTLETGEVTPIGSDKTIEVDVRVIAATNKDLPALIQRGEFREDLFYRLNIIPIQTPPLAARKEDIPLLVHYFLKKTGKAPSVEQVFSSEAIDYLKSWSWPGNVRELNNVVERAVILSNNRMIDLQQIKSYITGIRQPVTRKLDTGKKLKDARAEFEHNYITQVLKECGNIVAKAADRLGIQRAHLHQKINELGIHRTREGL